MRKECMDKERGDGEGKRKRVQEEGRKIKEERR